MRNSTRSWVIVAVVAMAAAGCRSKKNAASDLDDTGSHASMVLDANGDVLVASYWRDHRVSENRTEKVGALTLTKGKILDDGTVRFGKPVVIDGDEREEGMAHVGQYTSTALASDGFVRISYYDKTNGDLKLATQTGKSRWEIETVDSSGNVGGWTSLVLENDLPRIAYYDYDNGDLLFAAKTAAGTWNRIPVDAGEWDAGRFASLASDGNGGLAIAYYDATYQDLGYVTGTAEGFGNTEWLDMSGDVGRWPSLAFDLGSPRIAYQDETNQDLKLIRKDGDAPWQKEVVDAGDYVGADSSLVIDPTGAMTIVYFDGLDNDVLAAKWNGQEWELSKVAEAGATGYYNNLVLDASNDPVVGWYTFTGTRFEAQRGLASLEP